MFTPLVSIIIPAFNRSSLIAETLESVLHQTYQRWECIIVDDQSTDNTKDVVKSYCEKDFRFKLITRERAPKGAQTCRNIGIQASKGEYLIFLDSDDLLLQNALQSRTDFLKENINLDFCVSQGLMGKYPISLNNTYYYTTDFVSTNHIFRFCSFLSSWVIHNAMWKKNSIVNKGIYWNENLSALQDIDFHLKAILNDLTFGFVSNEPDCFYRDHSSVRISTNAKRGRASLFILNEGILPSIARRHRTEVIPLISYIIYTHYFLEKPTCELTEFIHLKVLGIRGFLGLRLMLPVIRRLMFIKIKGRSYVLWGIQRLFNIRPYLAMSSTTGAFSSMASDDVILSCKKDINFGSQIDV